MNEIRIYYERNDGRHRTISLQMETQEFIVKKTGLNSVKLDITKPKQKLNMETNGRIYYGILGLIQLENDIYLLMISKMKLVGKFLDAKIYQITAVDTFSLTNTDYDLIFSSWAEYSKASGDSKTSSMESHPCYDILKYLSSGYFYFSYNINLTLSFQKKAAGQDGLLSYEENNIFKTDKTFFWNRFLIQSLINAVANMNISRRDIKIDTTHLVPIICGFVYIAELYSGACKSLLLVSRVGCERAGTRFLSRGIDDDGNVANFVETEFSIVHNNVILSLVEVRGSVPIFWNQQGIQIGQPKIQLTRGFDATKFAFENHITKLSGTYDEVHILNLLSHKESSTESMLKKSFEEHVESHLDTKTVSYTSFDFNYICKNSFDKIQLITSSLNHIIKKFGLLIYDVRTGKVISKQKGVFRVNCLDCLDRTNVIQSYISKATIDNFSKMYLNKALTGDEMFLYHSNTSWADNGDALSFLYTGTGALKSGFTRTGKRTLSGFVDDIRKTTYRFYVNNFQDKSRQHIINVILGKTKNQELILVNDISVGYLSNSTSRIALTAQNDVVECLIYSVTWNVKVATPSTLDLSLLWNPLVEFAGSIGKMPDIIVVGLQEVSEISSQLVFFSDSNKKYEWEQLILETLDATFPNHMFRILQSVSLIGLLMIVLLKKERLHLVKKVEYLSLKTGLNGIVGNKGSVGIRFHYGRDSICVINSHFTSGQSNVSQRYKDYEYTIKESEFPSGHKIYESDRIIWLGDFNYRLDQEFNTIIKLISLKQYSKLRRYDQMIRGRLEHNLVKGFQEFDIAFPPTYKFVVNTNDYDIQRIPGWTDRILYRKLDCLEYGHIGDMMGSDHKPVYSFLQSETYNPENRRTGNTINVTSVVEENGKRKSFIKETTLVEYEGMT